MHEQLKEDIDVIRQMICELRENESSAGVLLAEKTLLYRKGISALERASEALQMQVYA